MSMYNLVGLLGLVLKLFPILIRVEIASCSTKPNQNMYTDLEKVARLDTDCVTQSCSNKFRSPTPPVDNQHDCNPNSDPGGIAAVLPGQHK